MIVNLNLTPYMSSPDNQPTVEEYVKAVDAGVIAGKVIGPFTTTCPECGDAFPDADAIHKDEYHIFVTLTSDTFAMVVGCEGYFMVNPDSVGIHCPGWTGDDALGDEVTGVHAGTCNGNHMNGEPCN